MERHCRQRPRRHHQQVFALEEVLHLAEQRPVKLMRAGKIEGQRFAGFRVLGLVAWPEQGAAAAGAIAVPGGSIEPAAQGRDPLGQRLGAELAAHPACLGLGDDPDEAFFRCRRGFGCVEKKQQGFIAAKQVLDFGDGERLGMAREAYSGKSLASVRSMSTMRASMAVRRAACAASPGALRWPGIRAGRDQGLVARLPFAGQVLPLAYQPSQSAATFGLPCRHLRQ